MQVEKEVIERINKGDAKAFEQLYFEFYVYLCAVAVKYVYRSDVASEIVNDVFLSVWNNRTSLIYPVNAYLVRSVQNRCLNYYRKNRLQEISLSEISEGMGVCMEQQIIEDTNPLACLEHKDLMEKVDKAIQELPEKCREILIQHIYFGRSYEEIAQMKQISSSTVRVQIKIGLSKLKTALGDLYFLFCVLNNFV